VTQPRRRERSERTKGQPFTGLDRENPTPLYAQVGQRISALIGDGTFRSGARLPAERDLSLRLGVSRVTVRRALEDLVEQGLLVVSPHRGWFVGGDSNLMSEPPNALQSFTESSRELRISARAELLLSEVREATLDEADQLRIAPGAEVFHLERLRLLDDRPVAIHDVRVPLQLAPELTEIDFETASLYAVLDRAGHAPTRGDCEVRAEMGTERDRGLLRSLPLLVVSQVTYDHRMTPIELSMVRYRGDRYQLRTSLLRETHDGGEALLEPTGSDPAP